MHISTVIKLSKYFGWKFDRKLLLHIMSGYIHLNISYITFLFRKHNYSIQFAQNYEKSGFHGNNILSYIQRDTCFKNKKKSMAIYWFIILAISRGRRKDLCGCLIFTILAKTQ